MVLAASILGGTSLAALIFAGLWLADGARRRQGGFDLRSRIFLIGASPAQPACRLQKRLLRNARAFMLSRHIELVELYGAGPPRVGGRPLAGVDSDLLREALGVGRGFALVAVDADGRIALRADRPTASADLIAAMSERAGPPAEGARGLAA